MGEGHNLFFPLYRGGVEGAELHKYPWESLGIGLVFFITTSRDGSMPKALGERCWVLGPSHAERLL